MFSSKATRFILLFAGLFVAARWVYFSQLGRSPLLDLLFLDSEYYYQWARGIAAGYGDPPGAYWLSPLYSYAMAGLFSLGFGESPKLVILVQSALSLGTLIFLVLIAKKWFGETAAVITAGLAVLYGPWLYYDGVLVTASLILFLNALLLYLLVCKTNLDSLSAFRFPFSVFSFVFAGLVCGLSALARPSVLLFAAFLIVWLCIKFRTRAWRSAIAFSVACALALSPAIVHNWKESGGASFTTSSAGINFFIGNRTGASGSYDEAEFVVSSDPQREAEAYRAEASHIVGDSLNLEQASKFWFSATWKEIARDPGEWIVLLAKKLWLTIQNGEIPNNLSFLAVGSYAPIVKALPIRWGILFPLACAGLFLVWHRRREFVLPGLYVLAYMLANIIFFSSSEYRLPLILVLLPFAAAFFAELWKLIAAKSYPRLVFACAVYLTALVVASFPSNTVKAKVNPAGDFANLGTTASDYGKYDIAIGLYARALARDEKLRDARLGLADALWKLGNFDDARREYAAAGVAPPDSVSGSPLEAVLEDFWYFTENEEYEQALGYLDKVFPPDAPRPTNIMLQRAMALTELRRYDEAIGELIEAGTREPDSPEWPYKAAVIAEMGGKVLLADSLYKDSIRRYPAYAPARVNLGLLAIENRDAKSAREQLDELKNIRIPDDSLKQKVKRLEIETIALEKRK